MISFFHSAKGIAEKTPTSEIPWAFLIEIIRQGQFSAPVLALRKKYLVDKKAYNKDKTKLPYFTPSGVFSVRNNTSCTRYSQVISLDIDSYSGDLDDLKERICFDKHTFACFISPSGAGLKVFVRTNANVEQHADIFIQVSEYYAHEFDLTVSLDTQCKDIARACFISFDEQAYLKENSTVFYFEEDYVFTQIARNDDVRNANINVESLVAECEKQGANLTQSYEDWLKVGFSLLAICDVETARGYFHRLCALDSRYVFTETDYKFNSLAAKKGQLLSGKPITGATLFFIAKEAGVKIKFKKSDGLPARAIAIIINNVKIGAPKEVTVQDIINEQLELNEAFLQKEVEKMYEELSWLKGTHSVVETKKGNYIRPNRHLYLIARSYVRQHLQPRRNRFKGVEILFDNEYVEADIEYENLVTSRLGDYNIVGDLKLQATFYNAEYDIFDPVQEFFNKIGEYENEEKKNVFIETLFSRINCAEINEDFALHAITWQMMLSIEQVLGRERVNDYALGFVSDTQGTGKTLAMRALMTPAIEIGLFATANAQTYSGDKDSKALTSKTWFIFDDEMSYRSKAELSAFKAALSATKHKIRKAYAREEKDVFRTCSYCYCGNNTKFLMEKSRRDLIIPFKEDTRYDKQKYVEIMKDKSYAYAFWAFVWKEYTQNFAHWIQKEQVLRTYFERKNDSHFEETIEHELIERFFMKPDPDTKLSKMDGDNGYKNLKTSEVMELITKELSQKHVEKTHRLNEKKIKSALKNLGIEYEVDRVGEKTQHGWRVWVLRELSDSFFKERNIAFPNLQMTDPNASNFVPF